MVICFDATTEAKKALDLLLATKQFRDMSEVISLALTNYEVLQRSVLEGRSSGSPSDATSEKVHSRTKGKVQHSGVSSVASHPPGNGGTPELFTVQPATYEGVETLKLKQPDKRPSINIPPKDWLFGQLNRFLPAKATCRALLNMLRERPAGILVADAASKISFAACDLGDYLRELDAHFSLQRQDSFAAAFPSTAYHGAESRLRFGSQFVGNLKQGQLTGLPAGLKLIQHDASKDPKLFLTDAGFNFALLSNPLMDPGAAGRPPKLGDSEVQFLLDHITKHVATELSAYVAVIDGIKAGAKTPEKLDAYLTERFALKVVDKAQTPNEITQTFLTTQRTGAISRMADLDLVGREKSGLRVTYLVTHPGDCFRSRIQ